MSDYAALVPVFWAENLFDISCDVLRSGIAYACEAFDALPARGASRAEIGTEMLHADLHSKAGFGKDGGSSSDGESDLDSLLASTDTGNCFGDVYQPAAVISSVSSGTDDDVGDEGLSLRRLVRDYIMMPVPVMPSESYGLEHIRQIREAKRNQGSVELMRCLETGHFVAAKRMPNEWVTGSAEEFARKHPHSSERPWMDFVIAKMLNDTSFPFVCKSFGIFRDDVNTFAVSEYANGGDLFDWCQTAPSVPGPERERVMRPLVQQMFMGMGYLHQCGIAHRDVSLENIVVAYEGGQARIKFIDFGMATLDRRARSCVGKPPYQAPEMHLGEYDAFLMDSFAIGVTVFCMGASQYPWHSTLPGADATNMFGVACTHGLVAFFDKQTIAACSGKCATGVFTASFLSLLQCLMEPVAAKRYSFTTECLDVEGQRFLPSVDSHEWLGAGEVAL